MFDVRSFKISKNDHIIDVQQFDDIDFVCPYYSTVTSRGHRARHGHHEYYVIYRVSGHSPSTAPTFSTHLGHSDVIVVLCLLVSNSAQKLPNGFA